LIEGWILDTGLASRRSFVTGEFLLDLSCAENCGYLPNPAPIPKFIVASKAVFKGIRSFQPLLDCSVIDKQIEVVNE
jgi:hypothetical protein